MLSNAREPASYTVISFKEMRIREIRKRETFSSAT
jgi:hypothetical protein